jgi:hypothetical protein
LNEAGPCINTKAKTVKMNVLNIIIPTAEKKMCAKKYQKEARDETRYCRFIFGKNNG